MTGKEKTINLIPKRVQIETIYGCNIRCKMCPVHLPNPPRKREIMSIELYKKILKQLEPYKDEIKLMDLWGVGDPLIDPYIGGRIRYAKDMGFKNIAIATNAKALTEEMQFRLLEAGIDTIILGIDGITKEVHESLRIGTDFDEIIKSVNGIIEKRNSGDFNTRFIIRFVKQKENTHQWKEYKKYWKPRLNKKKGDMIISYSVRPWYKEVSVGDLKETNNEPCHHPFDRLIVLVDGTVPLCCGDFNLAEWNMGNINDTNLIDIFNNDKFNKVREIHLKGKKNSIDMCKNCWLPYNEARQERWNDDNRWDYKKVLKLEHL